MSEEEMDEIQNVAQQYYHLANVRCTKAAFEYVRANILVHKRKDLLVRFLKLRLDEAREEDLKSLATEIMEVI